MYIALYIVLYVQFNKSKVIRFGSKQVRMFLLMRHYPFSINTFFDWPILPPRWPQSTRPSPTVIPTTINLKQKTTKKNTKYYNHPMTISWLGTPRLGWPSRPMTYNQLIHRPQDPGVTTIPPQKKKSLIVIKI